MKADPVFHARLAKEGRHGFVDAIGHGVESGERLYRIRYDDGDFEHVTLELAFALMHGFRLHDVFPSR